MWLVETVFSGLRKQGADISKARLKLIDRDISWGDRTCHYLLSSCK